MEHNCNYDKVKLLEQISSMIWTIEKHYVPDAEDSEHPLCVQEFKELAEDLKKHKEKIKAAVEGLAREGKFQ